MKIRQFVKKNKWVLLFLLFILSFSLFMASFCFFESDYYWHIKAGKYMFNNKTILISDKFSWYLRGTYWFSHEWLFEILLYLLSTVFPGSHVFVYVFVFIALLQLIIFITNKKDYLKNIPFSLFWMVLSLILLGFLSARPHIFSNVLLCLTIYILFDLFYNENSKKIYFLPLISIIWANVHGGSSSLIYILILIFLFCGMFKFKFSKIEAIRLSKKKIHKYLIVLILSILCLTINPHGIKMILYPYMNMADSFMMSFISEWHPTNFSDGSHFPYLGLLVLIAFIFIFSKKKIRFIDLILFCFVAYLGLKSIRFWSYTYIICSYFVFYYISGRKYDKGTSLCFLVASFLFVILAFMNGILPEDRDSIVTSKVIDTIKLEKPKRLYNYYDYGGYLIYNDIDVFVDGRFDLYSKNNMRDYYDICNLNGNYVKLINKYKFDYYLVPNDTRLSYYLEHDKRFEKIFSKKDVILYKDLNVN